MPSRCLAPQTDLGDRLSGAFTAPSSVPYSDVNLHSGVGHAPRWGPDSSTAEVGSLLLEFTDLSLATHRDKYQVRGAQGCTGKGRIMLGRVEKRNIPLYFDLSSFFMTVYQSYFGQKRWLQEILQNRKTSGRHKVLKIASLTYLALCPVSVQATINKQ